MQHVSGEKLNGGPSENQKLHAARDVEGVDSDLEFVGEQVDDIAEAFEDIEGHAIEDHVLAGVSI